MKNEKGFTLIELLVVIAIIGILAVTITIAYNRARQAANDSKRKEIVRNISSAQELYYSEEGGYTGDLNDLVDDGYLSSDPNSGSITALDGSGDEVDWSVSSSSSSEYCVETYLQSDEQFHCSENNCGEGPCS